MADWNVTLVNMLYNLSISEKVGNDIGRMIQHFFYIGVARRRYVEFRFSYDGTANSQFAIQGDNYILIIIIIMFYIRHLTHRENKII